MALSDVTPVLLTFDEEDNVDRALASLARFPRVVVLDSGSTDGTERIARGFPNVSWFVRPFDGHVRQWEHAVRETGIKTPFALALDADMSVPEPVAREIATTAGREDVEGAVLRVEYRIRGVGLPGSLYPAQLRLFRVTAVRVADAGHTQEFRVEGKVVKLAAAIVHDDRKPLERFVRSQLGYSAIEVGRLGAPGEGKKLKALVRRRLPFAPQVVWALAWLHAGGPFRGAAARRYALERLVYESLLRWRVEDEILRGKDRNG